MSINTMSRYTDKAPISPTYMNAKMDEIYANLTIVDAGQVTSGVTTRFPNGQDVILQSIDSGGFGFNIKAFGADPTAQSDSAPAIRSAISAAITYNAPVLVPPGLFRIDSTVTVGPTVQGVTFIGAGRYASVFTNNQPSDMFSLNVGTGFGFSGCAFQVSGSTYSKSQAIHITGNTNEFHFRDCEILSIGSFGILMEADTASGAIISDCVFYTSSSTTLSSGQSNVAAIGQRGADTAARPKMIANCIGLGGTDLWNLDSPNDIFASNCFFRNAVVTAASGTPLNVNYSSVRLATLGYPTYLRGNNATFINGIHPGNIIIDSGALACNVITSVVSGIQDNSNSTSLIVGGGYNQGNGVGFTGSFISIGGGGASGSAIRGISSTSSLIGAFVVQGSASSFTVIAWTQARANDIILATPTSLSGAVSSLSSGIVVHSHCTQNGQVELRLSNVSTLAQNVSSKTWYLTRITPF